MTEPALRLVSLHISPVSERARWVLSHHELSHQTIQHVPFIGERKLRRMLGAREGRVTVPALFTPDGTVLTDSWDIALYADREGRGAALVAGRESAVRPHNDLAEHMTEAGRALISAAMLESPGALDETLPREVPGWLRPLLRPSRACARPSRRARRICSAISPTPTS